jgi:hypothetical protein
MADGVGEHGGDLQRECRGSGLSRRVYIDGQRVGAQRGGWTGREF